jgi:hypothetical protein
MQEPKGSILILVFYWTLISFSRLVMMVCVLATVLVSYAL